MKRSFTVVVVFVLGVLVGLLAQNVWQMAEVQLFAKSGLDWVTLFSPKAIILVPAIILLVVAVYYLWVSKKEESDFIDYED